MSNNKDFREQIKPHLISLYRLAYRFTNNQTDAEDLIQDLMIKLVEKAIDLSQLDNPRTWLAKALYHQFIDLVRKTGKTPSTPSAEEMQVESVESPDTTLIPEQALETALTWQKINQALQRLNQDQRNLVLLHDVEGYTLVELEQILTTPIGTLKSRLHRARQQLRNYILMEPIVETERVDK